MASLLLIGSPNAGKSLLFNRLTGLNQKVANFPGITTDIAIGEIKSLNDVNIVDFPGIYSLQAISAEEAVAVKYLNQYLQDNDVQQILCVVDVTRLEKSLYLAMQVIRKAERHRKPVIVLANMIDILQRHQLQFDIDGLAAEIKTPIIAISAKTRSGFEQLLDCIRNNQQSTKKGDIDSAIADTPDEILRGQAYQLAHRYGPKGGILVRQQNRIDDFLLHSQFGGITFFVIMYVLFQSIFSWSAPLMDAVGTLLNLLSSHLLPHIHNTVIKDFVADAIFGGIGAFLVFVPQVFVLTLLIGILEDSGYLARAALICHKPLRLFGLTGKSFIPLLSGMACAIPAIYATRSIDSPAKRLLTYIAIPLMPCSARLPVYSLLISTFIPSQTALWGLIGWQGLAMFCLYFFGIFCALLITALISRLNCDKLTDLPFVLEMPNYRLPVWQPLLRNALNRCQHFVTKAGKIIFAVTVTVWILGYLPNFGEDLSHSWLAVLGRWIEPVFAPIGLDWRYGVAVLSSFLAREVFVGTLGTLFGIAHTDEHIIPLATAVHNSGLSVSSGIALLVLFAIALQCVSTLAVLSKESQSRLLAAKMFIGYSIFAYLMAFSIFNLVNFLSG